MPTPTEFWNWTHTDPKTGKRRTTRWKMQRAHAEASLIDPEPVEHTREVRMLPSEPSEQHMTGAFLHAPRKPPKNGA